MELDVFSSFLSPANNLPQEFKNENKIRQTETVPVKTLCTLFESEEIPVDRRIFLKMDTQGFDLEVLKGAGNYLDQVQAIQSELSFRELYQNMPAWDRIVSFMQEKGFVLAGIYEVCSDKTSMLEADGIFVRPL